MAVIPIGRFGEEMRWKGNPLDPNCFPEMRGYDPRDRRYRFRLGVGDVAKHTDILKDLLRQGYDRRNAE